MFIEHRSVILLLCDIGRNAVLLGYFIMRMNFSIDAYHCMGKAFVLYLYWSKELHQFDLNYIHQNSFQQYSPLNEPHQMVWTCIWIKWPNISKSYSFFITEDKSRNASKFQLIHMASLFQYLAVPGGSHIDWVYLHKWIANHCLNTKFNLYHNCRKAEIYGTLFENVRKTWIELM